ncbi:hypothetical protein JTB14_024086 [Gonioctena quinquepunctata]|nr:hypothetical protein JTB14_024086 [Gonioctena quinquepunctata]
MVVCVPNPGIENQQIRSEAVNNVPNEPGNEDEDIARPSTSDTNIEEATHFTPPTKAVTSSKTPEEVRPYPSASPRKTQGSSEITDIETKFTEDLAEESFANGLVAKDHFILVEFFTKKSHKYYVGQVRDIEQNGDYLLNFMRRTQPGYHFVFPAVGNVSMVPHPCSVGGTARVNRKLSFPINFTKFER